MGFEIKNICTVVPNPHHLDYKKNDGYYYFSVFITPRLQFDGTLKEFYEILYWPKFSQYLFWNWDKDNIKLSESLGKNLDILKLEPKDKLEISIEKDYYYIEKLCKQMDTLNSNEKDKIPISQSSIENFLLRGMQTWEKLFPKNTPVEAWPLYLKPQFEVDEAILKDKIDKAYEAIISNREKASDYGISENDTDFRRIRKQENGRPKDAFISGMEENAIAKIKRKISLKIRKEEFLKGVKFQNENTKFNQEFHKKISALSRYPHILRVLGLIQDYKICVPENTFINPFFLKLKFDLSSITENKNGLDFQEFKKSVQFVCTYTKCEIVDARLRAYFIKPGENRENPKADYTAIVKNGFIKNTYFEVTQDYYENQSNTFQNKAQTTGNVVGFNGKTFTDEEINVLKQKVQNQNNISKGFAIKIKAQPGDLLTSMDTALNELTDETIEGDKTKKIEGDPFAFMAHHLDCGYRVDVRVIESDKEGKNINTPFSSLCRREAKYIVDRKDEGIHFPLFGKDISIYKRDTELYEKLEDEPWLEEVRQIDEEGNENRFEEITRWNNWSLTCPPLRDNHTADNDEYNDLELQCIKPVKLPKLRFGQQYQFRIRTVDICGNGVPFDDNGHCTYENYSENEINELTRKITYERKEPIGTPLFFPTYELIENFKDEKNSNKKINTKYRGEDNETLVIRSKVGIDGKPELVDNECVRYITPPYITPHFAEVSGLLKSKWTNVYYLYDFLKAVPDSHYMEEDIANGIPFAIDGAPVSFEIVNNNSSYSLPVEIISGEPKRKPCKVALNKQGLIFSDNTNKVKLIPLKEGDFKILEIFSKSTEKLVLPQLKPKLFKLIHAVQRPIFLKKWTFIKNGVQDLVGCFKVQKTAPQTNEKPEEKYEVKIFANRDALDKSMSTIFPCSTTGEFILSTEYNEYELNPKNDKGWSYLSKANPKQDGDRYYPGINEGKQDEADKFYICKSWSNFKDDTEDDSLLDTKTNDDTKVAEFLKNLSDFKHSFPDTKFRRVKYKIEAISKYQGYFDEAWHLWGNQIDHHNEKNPFSIFGDLGCNIVANSAKPSKPNITSIVPVFTTTSESEYKGTYTFEHTTFRVYLGSTWYETGLEEKIAVIHEKCANIKPELEEDIYKKSKISIFANDPISYISSIDSVSKNANPYIDAHSNKLDTNRFENTIENTSEKPVKVEKVDHEFSKFEVFWDGKQFYADIKLDTLALQAYSYLVKFAVCRYQEHSIKTTKYDYRFSDVVMSDMVTVLPKRTIGIIGEDLKIDLNNQKGIHFANKGKSLFNKIYLVCETLREVDDNISDINFDKNVIKAIPITIRSANIAFDENANNKINIKEVKKQYKNLFIEEYEDIKLNDGFFIDDNLMSNTNYNPRNDPRKRLVFVWNVSK